MEGLIYNSYSNENEINVYGEYAIYLRKSRADMEAELKGEGETLARHEHILLDLANSKNLSKASCVGLQHFCSYEKKCSVQQSGK